MGVPNVVYKWKSLRILYVSVLVMNVAGCVIVVIMIVSAVKLRMGLGQYFDLVIPGDDNFWPGIMILVAFLCAPIYAIGIKLCLHSKDVVSDSIPRLNNVMFIHCLLCIASMIVIIGIIAVGIQHMISCQNRNGDGIIESMQEYATEMVSKVRIDSIQIKFRCCGSKSFKDWFHIRWMEKDGEIPDSKDQWVEVISLQLRYPGCNESDLVSTDVPFSCCATEILRPCIHHNILKPSEVYLYQPDRLTIATNGCHAKVLNHARYVGGLLIIFLILLAAYQVLLALLSRLLQTAHSNAFYIGPRKSHYLGWIFGSMPDPQMYNRLIYKCNGAVAEEMIPLRIPQEDEEDFDVKCDSFDYGNKLPQSKISTKTLKDSNTSDVCLSSSATVTSREKRVTKSSIDMHKETSNSGTNTLIPTPPPTPGTGHRSFSDTVMMGSKKIKRKKISKTGLRSKKLSEETRPPGCPERSANLLTQKSTTDGVKKKKSISKGISLKVDNGNKLKELRESLACLSKHQSPWKGGSPIFEVGKSSVLPRQSVRTWIRPKEFLNRGGLLRAKNSLSGEGRCRSVSQSSSSSGEKKHKVCSKDSIDEDELRIKKFCKDLSTEYKRSPYLKQRRDFSEQCRREDPIIREPDDGRTIRNEVCARFNPADTYNRFRGSTQDTMMRRVNQVQSGPPPIPICDQRTVAVGTHCRKRQFHCRHDFRSQFHNRPTHQQLLLQSQARMSNNIGTSLLSQHQKPTCRPIPTYFPIPQRSPKPPRIPSCSYNGSYQFYQPIPESCEDGRTLHCTQRELGVHSRYQGPRFDFSSSGQGPRFTGY